MSILLRGRDIQRTIYKIGTVLQDILYPGVSERDRQLISNHLNKLANHPHGTDIRAQFETFPQSGETILTIKITERQS